MGALPLLLLVRLNALGRAWEHARETEAQPGATQGKPRHGTGPCKGSRGRVWGHARGAEARHGARCSWPRRAGCWQCPSGSLGRTGPGTGAASELIFTQAGGLGCRAGKCRGICRARGSEPAGRGGGQPAPPAHPLPGCHPKPGHSHQPRHPWDLCSPRGPLGEGSWSSGWMEGWGKEGRWVSGWGVDGVGGWKDGQMAG